MYIYIYLYVNTYIQIHTFTYTYILIYIHTHTHRREHFHSRRQSREPGGAPIFAHVWRHLPNHRLRVADSNAGVCVPWRFLFVVHDMSMYERWLIDTHIHTHTFTRTHTYTHTHSHTQTHSRTHIHTHTHTHVSRHESFRWMKHVAFIRVNHVSHMHKRFQTHR